ncbi:hypothetical protein [Actinoplanes awajinensis]|uniref:Uncharacterized protein n=1 Tax=Actinoplanes awajinensis subsp. mycoplanecinus TaxID=135947 RepID=A0A117MJV5_9ACTN|nr:hypothetical protein [Actinoplanes awajinensis]KUL21417.1 hypothetical protein ADL15_50705 [Actinoplanes awajinensis subsp. mycoplanecinus]
MAKPKTHPHAGGTSHPSGGGTPETENGGSASRPRHSTTVSAPEHVAAGQDTIEGSANGGRPNIGGTPALSGSTGGTDSSTGRPKIDDSELAHDAIHGDVSTDPGEAVFWSGRTQTGSDPDTFEYAGPDTAMQMARDRDMTTLEGLIEERKLQMPDWDKDNPAIVESWTRISERYAAGVSGEVHVILGEQVRPGAVWETEFKTLMKNPNISSITAIDLMTGRERSLYSRGP